MRKFSKINENEEKYALVKSLKLIDLENKILIEPGYRREDMFYALPCLLKKAFNDKYIKHDENYIKIKETSLLVSCTDEKKRIQWSAFLTDIYDNTIIIKYNETVDIYNRQIINKEDPYGEEEWNELDIRS